MSANMAFATALIPSIAASKAIGDIDTVKKRVSFSMLITILIGMPCMVGMIIFAKPILELLFPNAASGSFIYQVSCLGIIFIVLEQTICGALHGLGKMISPAIALGIGVVIKLFLNCILIPINTDCFILGGTAGAAISTVICHFVVTVIDFNILKRTINLKLDKIKFLIKPVLATIIMGIITYSIYILITPCFGEKISTIFILRFNYYYLLYFNYNFKNFFRGRNLHDSFW